jgi:hypothetical protein
VELNVLQGLDFGSVPLITCEVKMNFLSDWVTGGSKMNRISFWFDVLLICQRHPQPRAN